MTSKEITDPGETPIQRCRVVDAGVEAYEGDTHAEGRIKAERCDGCLPGFLRAAGDGSFSASPCEGARIQQAVKAYNKAKIPRRLAFAQLQTFAENAPEGAKRALEAAQASAMDWAKRDHTDGALVIWGPVGTGKSALAAATLRYMIAAHGRAGFWAPTRKVVNAIRSSLYGKDRSAAEELTQALGTVEVLALDDLGWEHATEWASDLIDGVIDDRYNARRLTICTTNEDPRKAGTLSERIGQRSASRLLHGATVIRINGPDLRSP